MLFFTPFRTLFSLESIKFLLSFFVLFTRKGNFTLFLLPTAFMLHVITSSSSTSTVDDQRWRGCLFLFCKMKSTFSNVVNLTYIFFLHKTYLPNKRFALIFKFFPRHFINKCLNQCNNNKPFLSDYYFIWRNKSYVWLTPENLFRNTFL